ncbi:MULTISPECIES: PadR family transcriptional regulator [unclassified Plantibacter]|jgi:DNA-binding PadR family transcriptional regulator|uniref:PadR family transcriptional regulator n=1 Tax=unclassified Plantibacter TaxID=2624265 RepID=UPI003D33B105
MTPVFAHGSLRLYLLSLLAESPKHGYELIQALTDRSGGTYSPSAGTIYPRLAKLEEEGLVTKTTDGRKTVYEITDAGRAELAERESELGRIETQLTDSVRFMADEVRSGVTAAMKSLRADLASAAREAKASPRTTNTTTTTSSPAGDDPRTTSRLALHGIDVVLNDFRQGLRTELRTLVSKGGAITDETTELLRTELASVREKLRESLRTDDSGR